MAPSHSKGVKYFNELIINSPGDDVEKALDMGERHISNKAKCCDCIEKSYHNFMLAKCDDVSPEKYSDNTHFIAHATKIKKRKEFYVVCKKIERVLA